MWGDFNCSPEVISHSGYLDFVKARLKLPKDTLSTAKGSGIIDMAMHSRCLDPIVGDLAQVMGIPWSPHYSFAQEFKCDISAHKVRVQSFPIPLPMDIFNEKWNGLDDVQRESKWSDAQRNAKSYIATHQTCGHQILGKPDPVILNDPRFDLDLRPHI